MNLKEETLEIFEEIGKTMNDINECFIKYATHKDEEDNWISPPKTQILCSVDFDIENLNIEYDDSYGTQEVFGFISFNDGTWMERDEYDGSEWWSYKKCPSIEDYVYVSE